MQKKTGRGQRRTWSKKREEELVSLARRKAQPYLRFPGVTSVGVAVQEVAGISTGKLAIRFTVSDKFGEEELVKRGLTALPEFFEDNRGDAVPVDVVQRSYKPAFTLVHGLKVNALALVSDRSPRDIRRSRNDPVLPGISVGRTDTSSGTCGAIVYDSLTGTPYILSNWHVLCGATGSNGDLIVQPGISDDTDVSLNVVGRLERSYLGIAGDCAIASVAGRKLEARILELDSAPARIGRANLGDAVVKSGRTTGVTYGVVTAVGQRASVDYGDGPVDIGAFEIKPNPMKLPLDGEIADGGDSGSLWLVDSDTGDADVALGLHFAGELDPAPGSEHSMACYIHSVLEKLNVTFERP